jgi:hypothetical protein
MNRRALALWVGLAASVAGNIGLTLLLVNAGVLVDAAQSQADILWERRQLALDIIQRDWLGRPANELDALASALAADGVMVGVEGKTREIGDFLFLVEDGVVTAVRDLDSPRPSR